MLIKIIKGKLRQGESQCVPPQGRERKCSPKMQTKRNEGKVAKKKKDMKMFRWLRGGREKKNSKAQQPLLRERTPTKTTPTFFFSQPHLCIH
jgi:hypothetical protein